MNLVRQGIKSNAPYKLSLEAQRYLIYAVREPQISNLLKFWISCFSSYRPFWDRCTEWLQNDPQRCPQICVTGMLESQISLRFTLPPAVFDLLAILRQVHWMPPKWPWALQGQRYPIYAVSESQISVRFVVQRTIFALQVILRQMTPKWHWTLPPYIRYWYRVSNFTQFHSTISRGWVICYFETSGLDDPKWSWNNTITHICDTGVHESQISVRFGLRPAFCLRYNLEAILRQVHRMTPKWSWIPQGPHHMCVTRIPESQISLSFPLRSAIISRYKVVENPKIGNAPNDLKWA